MENTKNFDLIIIGTGAAASTIAYKCNAVGWKIAVLDSRPFGGTCALRGCDPKKVLVGAADVIDANYRMKDKGLHSGANTAIDWKDLIRFKRTFTDPVPKNREDAFNKAGISTYHGRAQFRGPRSIKVVTTPDDEEAANYIDGTYIVIASGAKPVDLNVPGKENMITSDQFLDLEYLPNKIVFV
ncbi:MAG: FAD-dependent oxidoreductase, partial [Nitrososphaeraceae archaeon]